MTTINSTLYYNSDASYSGSNRPNADVVDDLFSGDNKKSKGDSALPASGAPVESAPSTVTLSFQGKLHVLTLLDKSKLKAINVSELPEDRYQGFREAEKLRIDANKFYLESQYMQFPEPPDLSNYPGAKSYATVVVGGRVVAKIDNQGGVESDNVLGTKLRDILINSVNGTNGPDLAQARADQIAAMLGGRVTKASTAITQRQFNALPPIEQPRPTIDYEAMKRDPLYQQLQNMYAHLEKTETMRAEYLAKQRTGANLAN